MGLSKRRKALITLATLIGTFLAALAASLSPAFWVLLFFGLSALAVATLFPHGTAKDLVSREGDYG
ncbi:MAG TPA: hypothetical protein VK902_16660 [Rubrobacter sp.]|nr:hypothetical protein [Rubrobacter sp.]